MKKTRPTAPIPILVYLLTLLIWLGICTSTYYSDRKARADGRMPQMEAAQSDFALVNVLKSNDKLICITTDPQMWWYNYDNAQVRTVTMRASYSKSPLEICLFYLKKGEDNFSLDQRVYPKVGEDGTYTFVLPTPEISRLRLDICSDTCVIRDFSCTMNAPRAIWEYYVPTNWQLFLMLILPGLLASAISLLHNNILLYIRHGGPLSAEEIRAAVDQEDDDITLDAIEADSTEDETSPDTPAKDAENGAPPKAAPSDDTPEIGEDKPKSEA
jgi:hypothetical protein